jgi:putative NADH-flavin reductase
MKIVIFGATGKIGRNLVDQALAQGHTVTAFARSPEKIGPPQKNMLVVQGDVLDPAAVKGAIEGHDVVVCALGMPLLNKEGLRAKGTKIIISAMIDTGVKRLICLSGLGANDSRDILPLHYKFLIVPLVMRHLYADHERQEDFVRKSKLDWTIVRPASFVKGDLTGQYRHGFTAADKAPRLKISYADVADFMLKQLTGDTYLHQAPSLSY